MQSTLILYYILLQSIMQKKQVLNVKDFYGTKYSHTPNCQTREPFGEHLNKTAWKAYSDFLSSQHAVTPLPDDLI